MTVAPGQWTNLTRRAPEESMTAVVAVMPWLPVRSTSDQRSGLGVFVVLTFSRLSPPLSSHSPFATQINSQSISFVGPHW